YSNAGYIVLGAIIERVSWQSYDDYVREHIYEPAGKADTGAAPLDRDVPDRATGYTHVSPKGGMVPDEWWNNLLMLPARGGPAGAVWPRVAGAPATESHGDRDLAGRHGHTAHAGVLALRLRLWRRARGADAGHRAHRWCAGGQRPPRSAPRAGERRRCPGELRSTSGDAGRPARPRAHRPAVASAVTLSRTHAGGSGRAHITSPDHERSAPTRGCRLVAGRCAEEALPTARGRHERR